ncbi:MAG TPA: LacI family transcriptional regulator, partial [Pseudomonas sp.]|nr:LacI family transcriptional regulator [Pseudomonas sp.]
IDAVFFNNDDLALGALFRAHQLGLEVPGRLAIAGFNDLPAAAWMHPALSTVRTRRGEIGELAAQMLLSLMRGQQPAERCIDVGFEVVMRDSA